MRLRRLGAIAALLVGGAGAPLAGQAVPPLALHHLRVGIDSATWADVQGSPLFRAQFAAVDSYAVAGEGVRRMMVGRRNWLELAQGRGAGSFGIALTTESAARIAPVAAAWRRGGIVLDSSVVNRDEGGATWPWFIRWSVAHPPEAMVHLELDAWHPALFRRLAAADSVAATADDRPRALRRLFDGEQLFSEVTGATIALPVAEIAALRSALRHGGTTLMDEGEGLVVVLEDGVRFRFVPAWERPGLRRLEFYLTRAVAANPTYRFGPQSRLRFGPGRSAVWDFEQP